MKANRAIKNDRAEVGVGTLIVFIAMVLVAAVAAAVLINTTGTLQQRAQATGKEATQEVSSNLKVVNVYGERTATGATDKIVQLKIHAQLSAGAQDMDLSKLIVRFSDGTNAPVNYVHQTGACDATNGPGATEYTKFCADWLRGTQGSVLKAGDLVQIWIKMDDAPTDYRIDVRKDISLTLVPELGAAVQADFKTPPTYGTDKIFTLR